MQESRYVDVNTMLGVTNNNDEVRDEGAIINAYLNVILIPKRTRKFRPGFGSSAHEFLGRSVSSTTAIALRDSLLYDLNRFMPLAKIAVNDLKVIPNSTSTGYDLYLTYTSKLTNSSSTVTYQLAANNN